jgi:glycosyltransferase involved in cell wall biosynthesis
MTLDLFTGGRALALAKPEVAASGPPIYIEASVFEATQVTGIARYTARLAMALGRRWPVRFSTFATGEEVLPGPALSWSHDQDLNDWTRIVRSAPRRPLGTPPKGSIGLYCAHRPDRRIFDREVSVLHDFAPLIVPDTCTELTRLAFRSFFADSLPLSDLVIAVSHSTKADAAWLTSVDPATVVTAHSGPSMCVDSHLHERPVRRSARIGLAVSTLEPRKNTRFLLDWFRETSVLPADVELWWVGGLGWMLSREELTRLERVAGRKVKFLGYVSDAQLCKLYQQAGWTIYPSLYEGFGFPVLDALRHGTSVLTSGNSSLREFSGPGVHFFDPCDASTLDRAWLEFKAAGPAEIPRAALDEAYNWDRCAQVLLDFKVIHPRRCSREDWRGDVGKSIHEPPSRHWPVRRQSDDRDVRTRGRASVHPLRAGWFAHRVHPRSGQCIDQAGKARTVARRSDDARRPGADRTA